MNDNQIAFFKKLHEVSGEIVSACKKEDEKEIESAMGRFIVLMLQAEALL